MRTRLSLLVGVIVICVGLRTTAASPGDKRTIFTSGEKVFPIRYQLGQSTVLYFGIKPETVICGNKNYFNIEKIKDGLTIQPLSSFSTNLTVMALGRRYLFYLTPAGSQRPDGFVEVKWVPTGVARSIDNMKGQSATRVTEISQKVKVAPDLEISVLREISIENGKRRIVELELKNSSSKLIAANTLELVLSKGARPIERQVTIWEIDTAFGKKTLRGRIIATGAGSTQLSLTIGYQGKNTKMSMKGSKH